MSTKMKTVEISRKRWCRGGKATPALRTESGQSCCLGFVARAYGLKTPTGHGQFSELAGDGQDCSVLPKKLRPEQAAWDDSCYEDTELHDELTRTNDDPELRGSEREKEIIKLLRQANIRAVFVD